MRTEPRSSARRPAHALDAADVVAALGTDARVGLAAEEAARRLAEVGPNELPSPHATSPWRILAAQFKNILIVILVVAIALSIALGHTLEAAAIAVIAAFAVILGFVQEVRAERAIEALRRLAAPSATVVRDGRERRIPAREVVPGDVILLAAGDLVPADARLLEAASLKAEEAALTGESVAVEKHADPISDETLPVGDRRNIVFSSTIVTNGRGRAVVVHTGAETEVGKIGALLRSVEAGKTPLERQMARVGGWLARAAGLVVVAVVALGLARGQPAVEMLLFGTALAVAVVPEALPAVVTISLAIGAQKMARRNALIRRLPTVETLGSTTVICSDKTGTLTTGQMTVREALAAGERIEVTGAGYEPSGELRRDGARVEPSDALRALLRAASLCSDSDLVPPGEDGRWGVKGDPTEGALVVAAAKAGLEKADLEREYPRVAEEPFTSERKRMTTLHDGPRGRIAFSKGAPEVILDSCASWRTASGDAPLDAAERERIAAAARDMADRALRVIAVAERAAESLGEAERDMTFLGLVGMIDPPRDEAAGAIATCHAAGIRPVMITGDHPATAKAIAAELGVLQGGRVVTGVEVEATPDEELARAVEEIDVYARVSPAHKLRVVTALQANGHVVAMTGDGVNDAPALKKADIGVAMGITGTDVAKEAAPMTLTDDNFASIVAAVEEGRAIVDNIKKYLMYLLSSNIGEIGLIAATMLAGLPLPLTAVQILYVNLATDGLPALALAVDPHEKDLMRRPPRRPGASLLSRPVVLLMTLGGLWSAVVNAGVFDYALGSGRGVAEAMTMTFVSLVFIQFFKAYAFRSERHSILEGPFANRWLNIAVLWELALLVAIVYAPLLQRPFGTFSLTAVDWLIVGGAALTVVPVLELGKWVERRGWLGRVD